jgi:uncharacterized protein (DUF3084 family)
MERTIGVAEHGDQCDWPTTVDVLDELDEQIAQLRRELEQLREQLRPVLTEFERAGKANYSAERSAPHTGWEA